MRGFVLLLLAAAALALSGCAALAWVAPIQGELDNLSDAECSASLSKGVAASLEGQGEPAEEATGAAGRSVRIYSSRARLANPALEATPFLGHHLWIRVPAAEVGLSPSALREGRAQGELVDQHHHLLRHSAARRVSLQLDLVLRNDDLQLKR